MLHGACQILPALEEMSLLLDTGLPEAPLSLLELRPVAPGAFLLTSHQHCPWEKS
jgi:hypothetical protein